MFSKQLRNNSIGMDRRKNQFGSKGYEKLLPVHSSSFSLSSVFARSRWLWVVSPLMQSRLLLLRYLATTSELPMSTISVGEVDTLSTSQALFEVRNQQSFQFRFEDISILIAFDHIRGLRQVPRICRLSKPRALALQNELLG